ncbi:polysaccharide biosynthesis protein GumN [Paenibacillus antri]|uniref:Polysaccharide biosynthesis protein GumN n=1 Tax=Paenibacillus antri TaxID=2582848 RepID=A0A5R9G637_9BACL|nr:TraB/GumN family protein [Paenibacillus antri]TLS51241.1 polysaccharide biosynthesis protein GumN [Paenibacillus antri]
MLKLWKTKWSLAALTAAMALTSAAPASAATAPGPLAIVVDGQPLAYSSSQPLIEDGTTWAPLDATLEALDIGLEDVGGAAGATRTVGGESYLPLRLAGEAGGYVVEWDEATRTVTLISKRQSGALGFLWRVDHDGDSVYLVGSMHIADESFYPLPSAYEEAFQDAEYLGVEVDVSQGATPEVQQLVMSLGMYQDGTTLQDRIPEELYGSIGEILAENGLEANAMDAFKPWMAEMTLASLKSMQAGFQGEVGIDMYFLQKAIERQLPILELESYESQLQMFDGFSEELQRTNLKNTVESFELVDESVSQMAEMWKNGDEAALLELTEAMATDEEYRKAMLTDRNIGMADKIAEYLENPEEADYLVVLGAAHFLGEDGIVKLLEDKGYVVTRQ